MHETHTAPRRIRAGVSSETPLQKSISAVPPERYGDLVQPSTGRFDHPGGPAAPDSRLRRRRRHGDDLVLGPLELVAPRRRRPPRREHRRTQPRRRGRTCHEAGDAEKTSRPGPRDGLTRREWQRSGQPVGLVPRSALVAATSRWRPRRPGCPSSRGGDALTGDRPHAEPGAARTVE